MRVAKLLFAIAALGTITASAQSEWQGRTGATVGATVHLYRGKGQHFPGLRIFASGNIQGNNSGALLCYSLSAVLYSKSIGASLNPLVGDVQLDIINSVSVGYQGGDDVSYYKFFRTVGMGDFYNIQFQKEFAGVIGTNLILNNHRRNQFVGHLALSAANVTVDYYNDGAPPISTFSLGDEFDRWWTGGFGIFIHNKKFGENKGAYNHVEFSFDQFTGYMPQLYELSNILGLDVPRYGRSTSTDKYGPPAFNTSTYKLKVFPTQGLGIDLGIIGSLRTKYDKAFGLQELIHIARDFALHPNRDINRFYIGASYIHSDNEK